MDTVLSTIGSSKLMLLVLAVCAVLCTSFHLDRKTYETYSPFATVRGDLGTSYDRKACKDVLVGQKINIFWNPVIL